MIKIVHKNLSGVSNMADQGRIILQSYYLCNLSIDDFGTLIQQSVLTKLFPFEIVTLWNCRPLSKLYFKRQNEITFTACSLFKVCRKQNLDNIAHMVKIHSFPVKLAIKEVLQQKSPDTGF